MYDLHSTIRFQMVRDSAEHSARPQFHSPGDCAKIAMDMLRCEAQEHTVVFGLDTKNVVIGTTTVYIGTADTIIVRIAELLRPAILMGAVSIIIAHNHPSGDPTPSVEDVRTTENIDAACKLLSIALLDHIVVGDGRFVSLKERGLGFGRG